MKRSQTRYIHRSQAYHLDRPVKVDADGLDNVDDFFDDRDDDFAGAPPPKEEYYEGIFTEGPETENQFNLANRLFSPTSGNKASPEVVDKKGTFIIVYFMFHRC